MDSIKDLIDLIHSKTGIIIKEPEREIFYSKLLGKSRVLSQMDIAGYIKYLQTISLDCNEEWTLILDIANISESYFLRDKGQMDLLSHIILPEIILKNQNTKQIKIWCAGCSNGQEPYTISILLHKLLPFQEDWKVSILGTDINQNSLQVCKNGGPYSHWSFRMVDSEFIQTYFYEKDKEWFIQDKIKKNVHFEYHNLLIRPGWFDFDLVICRNVFIYYTQNTVQVIFRYLIDSTADGGYILTGHSEFMGEFPNVLEFMSYPESSVYRKKSTSSQSQLNQQSISLSTPSGTKLPKTDSGRWIVIEESVKSKPINIEEHLEKAKKQADMGNFAEAKNLCNQILEIDSLNPIPYYILGNISEYEGEFAKAVEHYKKVIYLKPSHLDAYYHLSMLYLNLGMKIESNRTKELASKYILNHPEISNEYWDKILFEDLKKYFKQSI